MLQGAWGGQGGRRGDKGGGGGNKITFYWPTTPEECLFVCVHDVGNKKLMHKSCGAEDWAGHCCPLEGTLHLCV